MNVHEMVHKSYAAWHVRFTRGLDRLKASPLYRYMRPQNRPVLVHKVTLIWLCRI